MVNDNGLPDIIDFGEAIWEEYDSPKTSKLAGTSNYLSYKLKTALKEWKTKQPNTPLPFVEHDLKASEIMSLALTIIALCRLSEDAILNDLDTCDEA